MKKMIFSEIFDIKYVKKNKTILLSRLFLLTLRSII